MLSAVNLNDDSRIFAQEIYFHSSPTVERNGQVGVHLESSSCLRQRFQASIEKRLGRASRPIRAFGFGRDRTSRRHEQARERGINTVTDKPTHASSVVAFPEWIGRRCHVFRPAR